MKKALYILAFFCITGLSLFLLWRNPSVLNKEPILSNNGYQPALDSIKATKRLLLQQKAGDAVLEKTFIRLITSRIFPYWYGTKWAFYGTTEKPNEGSIACGYFVTTTLRDMGVPISRIKMAQCASEEMIKSVTAKKHIYHLSNMSLSSFENRLKLIGNGIYIVGLDNHTGFLWISPHGNFFIHSSGAFPFQVIKEPVSTSAILEKSAYRVVGRISADKAFLHRWITYQ